MERIIRYLDEVDDLVSLIVTAAAPGHYLLVAFVLAVACALAVVDIPPALLAVIVCVVLLPVIELGICAARVAGRCGGPLSGRDRALISGGGR